jgi:hypothetical protein
VGGAGNDRYIGGPGNDVLTEDSHAQTFGLGKDRFAAGPGRDLVFSWDGVRERVDCSSGVDEAVADKRDRLIDWEKRRFPPKRPRAGGA